jgi:hypothetical protein
MTADRNVGRGSRAGQVQLIRLGQPLLTSESFASATAASCSLQSTQGLGLFVAVRTS